MKEAAFRRPSLTSAVVDGLVALHTVAITVNPKDYPLKGMTSSQRRNLNKAARYINRLVAWYDAAHKPRRRRKR